MKKIVALTKACMTDNMSLFKYKIKKNGSKAGKMLPVLLAIVCFFSIWSYANLLIDPLSKINMEHVLLTMFVLTTALVTFVEGIYKSGNLLFNCKDDDMLLSLPIKKHTILFVRIFKFYVFEVLYNALIMLPAMCVYARYVKVGISFYAVSILGLLLLPVIPIVISCILGTIISASSAKFKYKNIAQIIFTLFVLIGVMFISLNIQKITQQLSSGAVYLNNTITKFYYPASAYVKLVTNFNFMDLLIFIGINVLIFAITLFILSKVYFKINSSLKIQKKHTKNKEYVIKTNSVTTSIIKKELNKFISSPVFVINAGFGLVLYVVGVIIICLKFDALANGIASSGMDISIEQLKSYMPVVLFGLICFASLTSSITSSMISLEGKTFSILKSLPVKPFKIINSKILTAVIIMLPFILVGDLIVFIRFKFNIFEILILLLVSIVLPLIAETIGILANLKYPKMDAENDTEVVKQSASSTVATLVGFILVGISILALVKCVQFAVPVSIILVAGLAVYSLLYIGLLMYLNKNGVKQFNEIN